LLINKADLDFNMEAKKKTKRKARLQTDLGQLSPAPAATLRRDRREKTPACNAGSSVVTSAAKSRHAATGRKLGVVWFKWSDLRLNDHEPLHQAHTSCDVVVHVHVIESKHLTGKGRVSSLPRCSPARAQFWRGCVEDLAKSLAGKGSKLEVWSDVSASDALAECIGKVCQAEQDPFASITIFTHADFCTEEMQTTRSVQQRVDAHARWNLMLLWGGLSVHHIDDLGFDVPDMPVYKGEFNRAAKKRPIRRVIPVPRKFKSNPRCSASGDVQEDISRIFRKHDGMIRNECSAFYSQADGCNDPLSIPSFIREKNIYGMAFQDGSFAWNGGESTARAYLDKYFGSPETFGAIVEPRSLLPMGKR
jgi:deoxyribodipyrimidine photolyase